jgi:cardiolipin synthase A/B
VRLASCVLTIALILCASCAQNPRLETPAETPPIVVRQQALAETATDPLLRRALDEYKNDAAIRELVDAVRRYSSSPLTTGNQVKVLVDGPETYAAVEAAMRAARRYIDLETFIYGADDVGRRFAALLAEKKRQGVEVRVLYDSLGSMDTPRSFFDELRAQGVEVREFRPMNPIRNPLIWDIQNRDHRKIVVIDGKTGFTGGINIDSTYASASTSRPGPKRGLKDGWRDTHVRIEGPAVAQLQQLFVESWKEAGGTTNPENKVADLAATQPAGNTLVTIVGNSSESDDRSLYGTYLAAFRCASRRLWITHAYFAPNEDLLQAMTDAAQRGVDVRLIVPSFTDSTLVLNATQATYTRLLKSGVKIYELKDALLHAKSVVIDGTVTIVGSANLDMRSFLHNEEVNAVVIDRDVGQRMEQVFEKDQKAARPLDLARWEHRSAWQRFKEFWVSLFKYWI